MPGLRVPCAQSNPASLSHRLISKPDPLSIQTNSFMLETIAIVLIVLWLLGLVSSYTMGGFIHLLLVVALVAIVLRFFRSGKA